jgi:hypothetical protein
MWGVVFVLMFLAVLSTAMSTFGCRTFRIVHSEPSLQPTFNTTTAFGFRRRYINGQCQSHDIDSFDAWLQVGVGAGYSVGALGLALLKLAAAVPHHQATAYYSEYERRMDRIVALRIGAKACICMAALTAILLVGLGSSTYCSADNVTCRIQAVPTSGFGIVTAVSLWLAASSAAAIGLYSERLDHENQLAIPQAASGNPGGGRNAFVSALLARLFCAGRVAKHSQSGTVETTTDTVRGPNGQDMQRTISTTQRVDGSTMVRETRQRMPVPETHSLVSVHCDGHGNVEVTLTGPFLVSVVTLIVTKANGSCCTTITNQNYTDQFTSSTITLQRRERRESEVHTRPLAKLNPLHARALADRQEVELHGTIRPLPKSLLPTAQTTTTLRRCILAADHVTLDSPTSTNPSSGTGGDQVIIERTIIVSDTIVPRPERLAHDVAHVTDPLCTAQERVRLCP